MGQQMLQGLLHRCAGCGHQCARPDRQRKAHLLQFSSRNLGRSAGRHHVGDQAGTTFGQCLADPAKLIHRFGRLDEHDVGAGFGKGPTPFDGLLQAERGAGIGASDHQKVIAAARIDRDLDALNRVSQRHHPTVRRVPAFLGHLLILDLDGLHTGLLVAAHSLTDIDQSTKSGVGIGDQRARDALGDGSGALDHVAKAHQAGVGLTQMRTGNAVAGHVQRGEVHPIGELCREHLEDAGCDDKAAGFQRAFECARSGRGDGVRGWVSGGVHSATAPLRLTASVHLATSLGNIWE